MFALIGSTAARHVVSHANPHGEGRQEGRQYGDEDGNERSALERVHALVAPFFRKRDFWACDFELKQGRVDVHTKFGQGIAIGDALVRIEYGVGGVVAVSKCPPSWCCALGHMPLIPTESPSQFLSLSSL